ncbi:extracellular solute-binding protein [Fluviispira vulneris]|uniref:extracellular solute-binding protein n=1 Tax=Fluviispira vulneris TaxID=2763012 RepID=UPI00164863BD|nr:extracellular solute-binding protein [Fluviispira vulneris]
MIHKIIIKRIYEINIILILIVSSLLINEDFAFSVNKAVTFSTSEQEPYIGSKLENNGYAASIVSEAYRRMGYKVKFEIYPFVRAKFLAENGKVDGLIPSNCDKTSEKNFSFSDPFPGNKLVILKKKSFKIDVNINPNSLKETLKKLNKYSFGVIRGTSISPEFDSANFINKQESVNEIQLIDKLMHDRIDFAVLDKFTVADLIAKERPNYIGKIDVLKPEIAKNPFHIAFSKKNPGYKKLQIDFNRGLKLIANDGTLEKIMQDFGFFTNKKSKDGKIKITIGAVSNYQMLLMKELSKEYEKQNPHVELEWRIMDEVTFRQRILSDFLIGDGQFDAFTIGIFESSLWPKAGWLVPITNLPASYKIDDMLKTIRSALTYKNKLYALPFYGESSITFYRKDLFQKAGLTMPNNPTYNDILKFLPHLHDAKNGVYGVCFRGALGWGANVAPFNTMLNSAGGRWFDEKWNPTIDTPEWQRAVQLYKDLITKYGPPDPWKYSFNEAFDLFENGKCAIWIEATSQAERVANPKTSKVYKDVGYVNAPYDVTPKGSYWLWIWSLAMPVSSKYQAEAVKFITWATSPEYNELVVKTNGWLSVSPGTRTSTYKNKEYLKVAPFAPITLQTIESANQYEQTLKPVPYGGIQLIYIPEFPALATKWSELLIDIISNKITIDKALKEEQSFAVEVMKASGYIK